MRRFAFAAALALAACAPSGGPGTAEAEQSLREANRHYDQAIVAGDRAALEQILASDYVYVTPQAEVRDRTATIALHGSGQARIESPGSEEVTIRWLGDHALVTGRFRGRMVMGASSIPIDERYSSIWQRQGRTWRIRHEHASMAPPPPPGSQPSPNASP
jgi:ketosteroid isomerase-like protein